MLLAVRRQGDGWHLRDALKGWPALLASLGEVRPPLDTSLFLDVRGNADVGEVARIFLRCLVDEICDIEAGVIATKDPNAHRWQHHSSSTVARSTSEGAVQKARHVVPILLVRILILLTQSYVARQRHPEHVDLGRLSEPECPLDYGAPEQANAGGVDDATLVQTIFDVGADVTLHPLKGLGVRRAQEDLILGAMAVADGP
mmetsp:Transcript_41379/g.88161  ORF Transcript_41379/g.88161 Transcript_41379/m.88161 type:complete len:201 (-) Transcript_41379:552-1154(-)